MPVRFIVIEIEWIKSAASRCLWLIFQSTLETAHLSPTVLNLKKKYIFGQAHAIFHLSSLAPTTTQHHMFFSCKLLDFTTFLWGSFFLPMIIFFCQILFEWSLSFPVSISCSLSNDTFGNIQKAYLERKRSVGRKTSSLTLGFSHILKYDILFILKIF